MPRLGPIKRRDLIRLLLRLGFVGPLPGREHEVMRRGDLTVTIPNPHEGDISKGLLARILRQAGVHRETWEKL